MENSESRLVNAWGPHLIARKSLQSAWIEACRLILEHKCEVHNLLVRVEDTGSWNDEVHFAVEQFCNRQGLRSPKQVMYTIFPDGLWRNRGQSGKIFDLYNRPGGMFDRLGKRFRGQMNWGTYFRRLTNYPKDKDPVNQLGNIIDALKRDKDTNKDRRAAYTMIIQVPGWENTRARGGPCLNYISLQIVKSTPSRLGLFAVYRNHDFLERAYGNYLGLAKLLHFVCTETGYASGPLTCYSSHAYISGKKRDFRKFLEELD